MCQVPHPPPSLRRHNRCEANDHDPANMLISNLSTSRHKTIPSRRIVDAPVRLFHLGAAVCFTGAYLKADSEHFQAVHVSLGYTLLGLVVFRIVWGLVGPRQARLSILRNKLKTMLSWRDAVVTRSIQWRQVGARQGSCRLSHAANG